MILDLLAKDPAARPQTAQELKARLAALEDAGAWSDADAQAWWAEQLPAATPTPAPGALVPLPKHPQSPLPAPRRQGVAA